MPTVSAWSHRAKLLLILLTLAAELPAHAVAEVTKDELNDAVAAAVAAYVKKDHYTKTEVTALVTDVPTRPTPSV